MSGQSGSGSRFKPLEVEGDDDNGSDSDSDESSVYEMRLSRDFYQAQIPTRAASPKPRGSSRSTQSSGSSDSAQEMRLSRDFYPTTFPTAGTSGAPGSGTGSLRSRSMPRETPPPEDSSGLHFVWDHYKRVSQPIHEEGIDSLGALLGQGTTSQEQNTTTSIDDDIHILRDTGFVIEYPGGLLGRGFYGAVYRGTYGGANPSATNVNRFAVKIIDLGIKQDDETQDLREWFETEKYILTTAVHQNIVSIRMIINMGDIRSFPFKDNPQQRFLSADRVYMIMDFANCGELEQYMTRNKATIDILQRINWIRDLFAGMLYLHSKEIIHGDVHAGNVLLFTEQNGIIGKWSDFGLGFVGSNKQYRFKTNKNTDVSLKLRLDLDGLCALFSSLLKDRDQTTALTPKEQKLIDKFLKMNKFMRKERITSLSDVHQKYRSILEDELTLD